MQQLLDQKTKQLDAEIQETTCLKTTARAAQEETEQAQKTLLLESERVLALSKRVEDLEILLRDLETGASGADTSLAALTAESMKLRRVPEKELTAALRTMSQAEKSAKEKAHQL